MIGEIQAANILRGTRGEGPSDLEALADALLRLSQLVTDFPEIVEFDVNPLTVFEDGRGLDDATMQALALQFNLSETTFVLPSSRARAHVRIFTPTFEIPFAGHPTLGTAHVVRALAGGGDRVTLEMKAGVIPVEAQGDVWTLQANAPTHRRPAASRAELAAMLGLSRQRLSALLHRLQSQGLVEVGFRSIRVLA